MLATHPNNLLERAQRTSRIASRALESGSDENSLMDAMADAVRAMWMAMNAVLRSVGVPEDSEEVVARIKRDVIDRGVLSEKAVSLLFDAQSIKSRAVYGTGAIAKEEASRLLEWANLFISESRNALAKSALQEHAVVTVTKDVESEGYSIPSGMRGTVVSVYGSGEAYAVEFADLPDGPVVVTVKADAVAKKGDAGDERD